MTTDPETSVDTPPTGTVFQGPWAAQDDAAAPAVWQAPDDTTGDHSAVAGPVGRATSWRVLGRWRADDQNGRIYALGRVKPRADDEAAEPAGSPLARAIFRALWRSWNGHGVLFGRAVDAASYGVIRRQVRAAEAAGDVVTLAEWVDRLERAKAARRDRLAGLPALLTSVAKTGAVGAGLCAGGVIVGGVAVAITHPAGWDWSGYWAFVFDAAHLAVTAAAIAGQVAIWAAVPGWLAVTWRVGKPTAGDLPGWLSPALTGAPEDVPITPSLVVTALRDLGITELRKAIKAMPDHGAGMLSLITTAGCGVQLDIALPSGTETAEVRDRQSKLAENLHRHPHEVHLTIPKAARTIRAWIADPGALDEPIGPSPLVYDDDIDADYYNGRAPWGEDLRGDPVEMSLKQCHTLVTGVSNQGKTAALRALLLWLAFDPTVEFWLGDLKGIGDWGMFAGLATILIEGPSDDHVVAVTEMVEAGVAEMNRRLEAVQAMGTAKGVTRDMARTPGSGLHPLKIVVDEAQVAFMCPKVGDDKRPYGGRGAKSRFFHAVRQIQNQGRAVNVTIDLGTQDPTNDNLPKIVREAFHIRASLFVGTESQARMALGEAAVDGGAAPHRLRRGLDRGTVVVSGDGVPLPRGAASMTVRTHYIDGDEAIALAERAKARRAPVETTDGTVADEPCDHLADLLTALRGEERAGTTVVLGRLAELDRRYEAWTFGDLKDLCEDHGFKPRKVSSMWIYAADVHAAITRRDESGEIDE